MSRLTGPAAWVAKADHDLLNIRNNLVADDVPWDTVCFHAQQAGEKLLKAYLLARGMAPERTHDLVKLLSGCTRSTRPSMILSRSASSCRLTEYSRAIRTTWMTWMRVTPWR